MLLSPQGFLSVSGRVAGAASQVQTFTNGIKTDTIAAVSGPIDIYQNGSSLRLRDTGDSNNVRAVLGDQSGSGGYLWLVDDSESPQAVIRGYASANVQAYFLAGRVGFGTSSPLNSVHVEGATAPIVRIQNTDQTSYNGLLLSNGTYAAAWYYGGTSHGTIPNKAGLYLNSSSITGYSMVVDEAGGVVFPGGSAVYAPAYDMQLHRGDSDSVYMSFTNSTTGAGTSNGLVIGIDSNERATIFQEENNSIRFGTNNSYRFGVSGGGNMGIGIEAASAAELVHIYQSGNSVLALGDTPNLGANVGVIKFQRNSLNGQEVGNIIVHDNANNEYEVLRFGAGGRLGVGDGIHNPLDFLFEVNGEFAIAERSSDPANPDEGWAVLWMSDGTGSGDDGDIMIKITAGATTKTGTLVDFSAL